MSVFLVAQTIGSTFQGGDLNDNWDRIEAAFNHLGPLIISGLVPSAGTGLSVDVTAGTALFGAELVKSAGFSIGGLADNTTNHLYLLEDGTSTSNTTGTAPADSVKLGTAVTAAGSVSSVATNWTSGRQARVRTESLVPGSGAGHPRAVNLNSWHSTNNEGNEVKGVLPLGSLPFTPQASGTEIRAGLISLGLFVTGGTNALNTNGGDVTCDYIKSASGYRGSGNSPRLPRNTITPASDADVTVSVPEAELPVQQLDTGSWTSGHNVILPTATDAFYIAKNNTAFAAVFKTAAGSGVTVAAGMTALIRCGGANYVRVTADAA